MPRREWSALIEPGRREGQVGLIVSRRPAQVRAVVTRARLSSARGLEGDRWVLGPAPKPGGQISLMNIVVARVIGGAESRLSLFGDNLLVDLDLSPAVLPAGARLRAGTASIEVTDLPHRGCAKFARRFGDEALALVNSPEGKRWRLRGIYARVIVDGEVWLGAPIARVAEA